jgi:hypothetical protein
MLILNYFSQNLKALEKFSEDIGKVRDEFDKDPREAIAYLRSICRFVCAYCGKPKITEPILKYFNFEADALCYDCQKLKVNNP